MSRISGNICQCGLDCLPVGTSKGAPTKKVQGALETPLDVSEEEGVGSLYVDVPSVPGTEISCEGVSGAEAATCALAPCQQWGSHFLIHAKVQNGLALVPSGKE